MNIVDILNIKYPLEMAKGNIVLQDDGDGVYIKMWTVDGEVEPTVQDLMSLAPQLEDEFFNVQQQQKRSEAYLPLIEQMDMQYWDSVNGTTNWADHRADVKNRFPLRNIGE